MTDQPTPLSPEVQAIFDEIDVLMEDWGRSIDRMEATAAQLHDLAAIEEEWSC